MFDENFYLEKKSFSLIFCEKVLTKIKNINFFSNSNQTGSIYKFRASFFSLKKLINFYYAKFLCFFFNFLIKCELLTFQQRIEIWFQSFILFFLLISHTFCYVSHWQIHDKSINTALLSKFRKIICFHILFIFFNKKDLSKFDYQTKLCTIRFFLLSYRCALIFISWYMYVKNQL